MEAHDPDRGERRRRPDFDRTSPDPREAVDVVKDQPDVVITGEIKRFFVAETGTYEGDVGLKIDVLEAVQNLFKNDGFRAAMKRSGP